MFKMQKVKGLVLVLCAAFLFAGCATAAAPVNGAWYSDVQWGGEPTSNERGSKVGQAEATSILGLIATGDASIETAAKNGKISRIHHVDYHSTSILGLFAKIVVKVYGE